MRTAASARTAFNRWFRFRKVPFSANTLRGTDFGRTKHANEHGRQATFDEV